MHRTIGILLLLSCIALLTRFVNLGWGSPFFFHPDERNIATAIAQLNMQENMHPHFFAYGGLPLYTIYFSGILQNVLSGNFSTVVSFPQAILIGRFFSALFSFLLIYFPFALRRSLQKKSLFLIVFLLTSSIGLIQYAHFATFEMWSTFFLVVLFCLSYQITEHSTTKTVVGAGIICGVLIAIKISNIPFLSIPLVALFLQKQQHIHKNFIAIGRLFICSLLVYLCCNPFVVKDFPAFMQSMSYEGAVATGRLPTFYTQGFIGTLPILYQFISVYPFILTPLITILFIVSFCLLLFFVWKEKNSLWILLLITCSVAFFSQSFLFVKWTRYVVLTLPFIYCIVGIVYGRIKSNWRSFFSLGTVIVVLITTVHTIAFIKTVYFNHDTRIEAALLFHALPNATIATEPYDLGILPFQLRGSSFIYMDPYDDLSFTPSAQPDYIILPSQRLARSRLRFSSFFPKGHTFYSDLFQEKKFKKIYETPCDIWCKITYSDFLDSVLITNRSMIQNPIFTLEETTAVFDRPTVFIFEKK